MKDDAVFETFEEISPIIKAISDLIIYSQLTPDERKRISQMVAGCLMGMTSAFYKGADPALTHEPLSNIMRIVAADLQVAVEREETLTRH